MVRRQVSFFACHWHPDWGRVDYAASDSSGTRGNDLYSRGHATFLEVTMCATTCWRYCTVLAATALTRSSTRVQLVEAWLAAVCRGCARTSKHLPMDLSIGSSARAAHTQATSVRRSTCGLPAKWLWSPAVRAALAAPLRYVWPGRAPTWWCTIAARPARPRRLLPPSPL